MTWSILQAPPPPLKRERSSQTERERRRVPSLSWEELRTKEETERDVVV